MNQCSDDEAKVKTAGVVNPEKQRDIQHALQQVKPAGRQSEAPTLRRSWRSTLIYAVLIVALGGVDACSLSHSRLFATGRTYEAYGERLLLGGISILALIAAERLIRMFLIGRLSDEILRYTVAKLLRFAIGLLILAVSLSALLSNWTTALVSLILSDFAGAGAGSARAADQSFFVVLYPDPRPVLQMGDRFMSSPAPVAM